MSRLSFALLAALAMPTAAPGADKPAGDYFPPPESKGGWRSALPATGPPNAAALEKLGVDAAKLAEAWEYNAKAEGATGLLVVRHGRVVGEWYRGCDPATKFNIYSSSKAYTSLAFGLLLADSEAGKLPGGKKLTLDSRVCTEEWLPEALPLPDPRKANITVRHLLQMTSGIGSEPLPSETEPFEVALGKTAKSPFAKLKADPGGQFNYSNAGVAHLVLVFNRAAGTDLYPFLKDRVFDPVGMAAVTWTPIGGSGKLGPLSQGYSGVNTTPPRARPVPLPGPAQGQVGRQAGGAGGVLRLRLDAEQGEPDLRGTVVGVPAAQGRAEGPGADGRGEQQPRVRGPEQGSRVRPPGGRQEVRSGVRARTRQAGACGRQVT